MLVSSSSLSFLQLNITTMRAEDGSFVEFSQVLVNQSVSEYVPPHQIAGSKYLVTVQGLTAAGAGPAAQLEFQTYVLGNGCSALCLVGVASQGVRAESGAASRAVCALTLSQLTRGQGVWAPTGSAVGMKLGEPFLEGLHWQVCRGPAPLQPLFVPLIPDLPPLLFH